MAIDIHRDDYDLAGTDDPGIVDAAEGRVLTRVHRVRERSRKLVEQAKALALKKHGRLACEACGFEFAEKYGPAGKGIIEVHHTKPVHTLVEGDRTRTEDLALLCANCHRGRSLFPELAVGSRGCLASTALGTLFKNVRFCPCLGRGSEITLDPISYGGNVWYYLFGLPPWVEPSHTAGCQQTPNRRTTNSTRFKLPGFLSRRIGL